MISLVRFVFLPTRVLFIGCLLLFTLCSCDGGPDPPTWAKIIPKDSTKPETQSIQATNHLVVYLDTSSSMAGYVSPDGKVAFASSPDGQTVYSHTLQELRNVVTSLNPPVEVVFRRVNATVSQPVFSDLELNQASVNRGTYTGKETNLAGAINIFAQPLKSDESKGKDKEDEEKPTLPARYHILITDGVQSTNQQRTDTSCTAGSDYVCIKKKLAALMEKGWAGTVLGIKSEFGGKVYSEINKGQAIPYVSKKKDVNTYRPFYLYLFSPDQASLDKLVEVLKERLRPVIGQPEGIREYALTSLYAAGFAKAEIVIPKTSADYLEKSKAREEDPVRFTLRVDMNTEKSGAKPFTVVIDPSWSKHALDAGTPKELAGLIKWDIVPVYPNNTQDNSQGSMRLPIIKISKEDVGDDGKVLLEMDAQWPPGVGNPGWRVYRLEGHLNLDKQSPPWVQQWSTNLDTSGDAANRTLNLESALAGLWRNAFMEKQVVAGIYLRVGPQ